MIDTRVSLDHEIRRERLIFLSLRRTRSENDKNREQSKTCMSQINVHDLLRLCMLRDGRACANDMAHRFRRYRPQSASEATAAGRHLGGDQCDCATAEDRGTAAMPPDVRRGYASPFNLDSNTGLRPRFGLGPNVY